MARAKTTTRWVCQQCSYTSPAYLGRCPGCESWHTMVETVEERRPATGSSSATVRGGRPQQHAQRLDSVGSAAIDRIPVPISELDRVLGGGLVPGSLVLVGGDPGIGKSTLVLQTAAALAEAGAGPVLYVSAEESAQQIRLRADRLGVSHPDLWVLSETDLDRVLREADERQPGLLIVDSIQTVYLEDMSSAAGSVSQVRECTARLMQWAKPRGIPVLIIGHVTKEGTIAGPRVLEHMVDAVLYLEGERHQQYRILRGVKNRFGSTDEVGVFEMADVGMREVTNPSEAFLEGRAAQATGSAVAITIEGTRPILVEMQALTTATAFGLPRRSANGLDTNRLQLLVAVLQKRVGISLGGQDIYANVVGGLRVVEPAADLAVALAVASSYRDVAIAPGTAVVGEIGLSGELRSVSQLDRRINEARRLGFTTVIASGAESGTRTTDGIRIIRTSTLSAALDAALGEG
ncbi:MAG: DNA repair protein RadA [uncultured Thermomicrobiales bacterium]|uniref:DNA repair protein RadA n=1 Tax=uncultured Thermomicrobiales bacterium TaxID=1645740 RepID=A0A6J4VGI1_9BACT|nr:MAG: DNA repair protein RadA [uncultured Thermomicrobiales bacterium]